MNKRRAKEKRGKDVKQAEVTAMASNKLIRLREWIDEDPTTRGYSGMTDNQVAVDMVDVEKIPKGAMSKWDVLGTVFGTPQTASEYSDLMDGTSTDVGSVPEDRRVRGMAFMAFMGGDTDRPIPPEHYDTQKVITRRTFGSGSDINAAVSTLLDGDTMSRAAYLGFPNEDVAGMTIRVSKARAL